MKEREREKVKRKEGRKEGKEREGRNKGGEREEERDGDGVMYTRTVLIRSSVLVLVSGDSGGPYEGLV